MKPRALVSKIEGRNENSCRRLVRLCIALPVTKKDLKNGTNAMRAGLHLFRGFWYGKDPFNLDSYGKIEGQIGKVVGRVRNYQQLRTLKRLGKFD